MNSDSNADVPIGHNELRQRPVGGLSGSQPGDEVDSAREDARTTVMKLNEAESKKDTAAGERKTFGRTPDGTVFAVPHTHDMVSQLLSPSQPKNISDLVVLGVLALHILIFFGLGSSARIKFFAVMFAFWRTSYNAGIGYLLHIQSHHSRLVTWAKKSRIFEDPATGRNPYPRVYGLLKREMEAKIPKDYKFATAPIEYNTWLLFRRVVDLILMCDFSSYILFAFACAHQPKDETLPLTIARWSVGVGLFLFNLWVKLDAHRVVKDFAWYWGDFFYLIDQNLTFDGVFEMAPHPMYSVGYAGYYGISLMAASYKVLFISIVAHAAQFAFLVIVENPHIEKTYNPPPLRRRASDSSRVSEELDDSLIPTGHVNGLPPLASASSPSPVHNLLGLQNFDLHRITDSSVTLLQLYLLALTVFTPSSTSAKAFFVGHALFWRLWYSIGIGYLLERQSTEKRWTRHFIKFGESTEEAWRQWKGIYHLSLTMTYVSFLAACWKMYALPPDWQYGMALLRHVLGCGLIALQIWADISIYDTLGEFGWFYGDFFFEHSRKLTYGGIYRFLNNPDRDIGMAGYWGLALITWSQSIFWIAFLTHLLTMAFVQFVERPHMQKVYGEELRQHSGVSRSIQRSLPSPIRGWHGSVDRVIGDTTEYLDDFVEAAKLRFAAGVETFVRDATNIIKHSPARISITRLAPDLAGFDPKDYSITVEGTPSSTAAALERRSKREGENAQGPQRRLGDTQPLLFEYGAPIRVRWTAPLNHSKRDWIGLYMIADNASRTVTNVSSQGRWVATNKGEYNSTRADAGCLTSDVIVSGSSRQDGETTDYMSGEMTFVGDKLWWTTGVYEFRYHHDGKHNVMATSRPFELRIGKFEEDNSHQGRTREALEEALLPVVQNCFDRDEQIAPSTVDESFGGLVERDGKFARRVVFAVHQMFGIEFAPEVVQADGTVKNLAWRVHNAKKVLVSYTSTEVLQGGQDSLDSSSSSKVR